MFPLVGRAAVIAAAGCLAGLALNAVRSDGLPLRPYQPATACTTMTAPSTVTISPPASAVTLCGDRTTLVADVRSSQAFAAGHVAGAIHLPCAASGNDADRALELLRYKRTLVVYGDTTEEARPVAEDLQRRAGRPDLKVVIIDGGFSAWDRAGLACAAGPCPDCGGPTRR